MNKRVVFIVVLIECILAVLLISIFGQAIYNAVNNIVVQEVYFTYADGTKIEDGEHLTVELTDSKMDYQLYWAIGPENASNQNVTFTSSKPDQVVVNSSGVVTFYVEVGVTITIHTEDGNQVDAIILIPQDNSGGDVEI